MEKELINKIAFITGGSSGIGRATAQLLAQRGANVFMVDIDECGGEETISLITAEGGTAVFHKADITKEFEIQRSIEKCINEYGRIDSAINNAGICIGSKTAKYSEEDFDRVIQVNLKGTWLCMKHEIIFMKKQGYGSIVNTSSIAGLVGLKHHAAYVASKHGIIGLTKTAAVEYASNGIRINAVCPGTIKTSWVGENTRSLDRLHPMGRIGQPVEIAEAICWLSSDKSSFMTGQSLVIDGGRIAGE
ncbi:SDR family oxidoreductase [Paenibacillus lycopersici]|uniref:SDR family oxidoreductase n=1 Tax=Paenibacillus lycopersici TaxID=2704462 RepID=A0A6C0FWN0_9BACL|nr:glucose 1-dehydrogenase [Paenibacillus lycopersici]QHT59873.1 SDR family oxidoreductase [Paenibacillus lycopersici]